MPSQSTTQSISNLDMQSLGALVARATKLQPEELCSSAQELVSSGANDLAQAICEAYLALYPETSSVLSMSGLVAAARGDWPLAIDQIERLISLRGYQVSAFSFLLLARAKRSSGDWTGALEAVQAGLALYPKDEGLNEFYRDLESIALALGEDENQS